jgi:hypothetical protein
MSEGPEKQSPDAEMRRCGVTVTQGGRFQIRNGQQQMTNLLTRCIQKQERQPHEESFPRSDSFLCLRTRTAYMQSVHRCRPPLILLDVPTFHAGHGYLVLSKCAHNPLICVISTYVLFNVCLLAFAKVQYAFTLQTLVLPQC